MNSKPHNNTNLYSSRIILIPIHYDLIRTDPNRFDLNCLIFDLDFYHYNVKHETLEIVRIFFVLTSKQIKKCLFYHIIMNFELDWNLRLIVKDL